MMANTSEPLAPGTALGHYVVEERVGSGGMGEVYAAHDTRLNRRVALKVVRRDVAGDAVRRERLRREAGAAALLNHPHIVTLHSIEELDGVLFLTMELVEGSTLAAAIPAGGFPIDRFLALAIQLADALQAAHGRGIIHRDLKPANIMITRDGVLKVLDFGLSKIAVEDPERSVTTEALSTDGRLVGTVPYMAPEQIEGQASDARSDLFSLGITLFEMATGRRPFGGDTPMATLTAILRDAPLLAHKVRQDFPEDVARIIDRCLVKDPARRTQSAADLRGQFEDLSRMLESGRWIPTPASGTAYLRQAPGDARSWARRPVAVAAGALAVALLAGVGVWQGVGAAPDTGGALDQRVARFVIDLPEGQTFGPGFNSNIALSPDGTHLAFAPLPGPVSIRRIDALAARIVETTDAPGFRGSPLFSPDGRFIAFIEGNAIFSARRPYLKAALSGGAPVTLTEYDMFHRGDWADGWIYWTAQYPGGIVRMPESGGASEPVTTLDVVRGERSHRFAQVLPGGRSVMYTVAADGMASYDEARIDVLDLQSGQRKTLIEGGTSAVYAPSGHLVYARAGKLLAVPFDVGRLEVTGSPFEVLDGVLMSANTGAAYFSISRRGDLAYVPGPSEGGERQLVWVDRSGKAEPLPLPPASYLYPRLSPDGRQLAVEIEGPNHDFYVYDFDRDVMTKMTTDGESHDPVWTPDGKRLAYRSWQYGGMTMWWMPADRSAGAERLTMGTRHSPVAFSPDGRFLAFDDKNPETSDDARVLALDDRSVRPVADTRFGEGSAKFSPDGRWIAYSSSESGRPQIYVQAFPGPGPKIQISSDGGTDPVWRRSGGELFYRSSNRMMVVSVTTSPFRASAPRVLWEGAYSRGLGSSCGMPGVASSNYDVTADGRRFLMVRDDDDVTSTRIVVALNWIEELKRAAAAAAAN
jgi:Tol biopolymer transport system component/tRNA A-37 threonylcarbamoyl transferase component Bud32